jgi:hypothetical protein
MRSRPAFVMRAVMSRRTRSRFMSESRLVGRRGEKRCTHETSSTGFAMLSIQPKQSASSTASL